MMPHYRSLVSIAAISLFALALACGDDDNGNGNGGPGPGPGGGGGGGGGSVGSVSFDISGDVDVHKEGMAYVGTFESDSISNYQFNLTDNETFTMTLNRMGEGTDAPAEGTYTLGTTMSGDFGAILDLYEEGRQSDAIGYMAMGEDLGTLEITSASSSSMSGTFEFEASNISDMEAEGGITISNGEFTAVVN